MKKFTVCALIISVLLMSLSVCSFAADVFSVEGSVDFDSSDLTVTIKTPALYEQNILVTIYAKDASVTLPAQYVRMGQTRADGEGNAEIVFNLSTVEKGHYTISATGGGKLAGSSHGTFDFYFETATVTNTVTLPALSTATGDELAALVARLESDYKLDMGDGYDADADSFLKYFEGIRLDDYDNSFSSMSDVQTALDGVNLIMATLGDASASELQALYEAQCDALELYDKTDADYTANSAAIYPILKVMTDDEKENIENLSDIRAIFYQAQGIATINTKDSETVTATIEKYGEVLGIDLEDYRAYCEEYGELMVNPDFIGRNFTRPSAVVEAYNDSIEALTGGSSGGSSGGGSGGSGGSPSSVKGTGTTETNLTVTEPEALPEVSFSDVADEHWAKTYIEKLAQFEVITGFEDGTFRPENLVTKEQFVKMVVEAFGIYSESTTASFEDVDANHWAMKYIAAAVDKGIINGKSETQFGIGENLSRQDAAVIIVRVADMAGYSLTATLSASFTDKSDISSYALDGVTRLSSAGIINGMGDGTFAPLGTLTRAQAAKMLYMMITSK